MQQTSKKEIINSKKIPEHKEYKKEQKNPPQIPVQKEHKKEQKYPPPAPAPRREEPKQSKKVEVMNNYQVGEYSLNMVDIPSKDLKITVNYEHENVDIGYSYNDSPDLTIKKLVVAYINDSLKKNGADVINPTVQL